MAALTKAQRRHAHNMTVGQVKALEWLGDMHKRFPHNDYGFNPQSPSLAAICRRTLEQRGFVAINRISPNHFRYALSSAGRAVLKEIAP